MHAMYETLLIRKLDENLTFSRVIEISAIAQILMAKS
jgi:hypothetical protein